MSRPNLTNPQRGAADELQKYYRRLQKRLSDRIQALELAYAKDSEELQSNCKYHEDDKGIFYGSCTKCGKMFD